jgi:hypothetical protein
MRSMSKVLLTVCLLLICVVTVFTVAWAQPPLLPIKYVHYGWDSFFKYKDSEILSRETVYELDLAQGLSAFHHGQGSSELPIVTSDEDLVISGEQSILCKTIVGDQWKTLFVFKPEPAILVANTTYQLDFDFRLIGDSLLLTSVVRPETFSGFDTDMGGAQLLGESGKAYHVTLTFTTTDAKPTWHWWFGCADEGIVVVDNIRIDKLVLKK